MFNNVALIMWVYYFIAIILITVTLNVIQKITIDKYKKQINQLEREKNIAESTPVMSELQKVKAILKNEKLEEKYHEWMKSFEFIKEDNIPKLTDLLLDLDYLLEKKDFKALSLKLAKVELEIFSIKKNAEDLLEEVREITLSEERNRKIMTNLKVKYRSLMQKFNQTENDYDEVAKYIELQFENIDLRFYEFEKMLEENDYYEANAIVKALDEMLKHMELVIEEVPGIVLLYKMLIPNRITQVMATYQKMLKEGYPLDYLSVEYNIEEITKKNNDIIARVKVLNLEDCILELKTMLSYIDNLFNDFEKERLSRKIFEDNSRMFSVHLSKVNKIMSNLDGQIEDLKNMYDLSTEDINLFGEINDKLIELNKDFKDLTLQSKNKTFAYSKLVKEIDYLEIRLKNLEEGLDEALKSLGNMYDDEQRAREQLNEIKFLLNGAKLKIRNYKLPLISNNYFVELEDANAAIKEIIKELEKKPVSISTLNIRVDTARDLALKLYNTTNEMVKTASLAEIAIVYGNRYRSSDKNVEIGLENAEVLFYKGNYKKSLEITINAIDIIEPGIYKKLLELYSNEK